MAKPGKTPSLTSRAKAAGASIFGGLTPFLTDTAGSLAAHALRDFGMGKLNELLSNKEKLTAEEVEQAQAQLSPEQQAQFMERMTRFTRQAQRIMDDESIPEDERKREVEELRKVYMSSLSPAKADGKTAKAQVKLVDVMQSWSDGLKQVYAKWLLLLSADQRESYNSRMDHFAPFLASMLEPYVAKPDAERRENRLIVLKGKMSKKAKEQWRLWFSKLAPADRNTVGEWAREGRLTAKMLEEVFDECEVPAKPISDLQQFIEDAGLRESYDEFWKRLTQDQKDEFLDFACRLQPGLLKKKLNSDRWNRDTVDEIFTELQGIAGTSLKFANAEAKLVLETLKVYLLDAVPVDPDADKAPELTAEKAQEIYSALVAQLPPPPPTIKSVVKDQLSAFQEGLSGLIPDAPQAAGSLPAMKPDETIDTYFARLIAHKHVKPQDGESPEACKARLMPVLKQKNAERVRVNRKPRYGQNKPARRR
ncbi:MAG: hypothetical protein ACOYUZ_04360 [Patescibacteria group bacterium]